MPKNTARILLVEPNEDHRGLLEEILQREGFGTPKAVDGNAAAIAALDALGDEFDAALIAIEPGNPAGAELCRTIKADARWRDIPVLFVAAQSEPHYVGLAYDAGALDYLRKPIDRSELRIRLRAATGLRAEVRMRLERERALALALGRLQQDLDAAASLQRSLLPPPYRPQPNALPYAFRFQPSERLGGDLLGVLPLPDGRTGFYVLDVAGHGVKAALQCVAYHRLLSVEPAGGILLDPAGRVRAPGEVVAELNRLLARAGADGDYLTMIYAIAARDGSELSVCQAGHPRLLLVSERGCEAFQPACLPVGMLEDAGFHTERVTTEPGTRVVLYTDGVSEALSGAGEQYGTERLGACLARSSGQDAETAAATLLAEVQGWSQRTVPEDDISVLIVDLRRT